MNARARRAALDLAEARDIAGTVAVLLRDQGVSHELIAAAGAVLVAMGASTVPAGDAEPWLAELARLAAEEERAFRTRLAGIPAPPARESGRPWTPDEIETFLRERGRA